MVELRGSSRAVEVIGVPLDLGQQRRGVDMGPSALRVAGLAAKLEALGLTVRDRGNVPVPGAEMMDRGDAKARFLVQIARCDRTVAQWVDEALARQATPVVLGGDHSLAAGSIAGVASHFRAQQKTIGLIWIDAHTDINTPDTSTSGNVHGMPLAALLGLGPAALSDLLDWSPKVSAAQTVLVGIRDIDAIERDNVRRAGVTVFTMRDIDEKGLRTVMERAIEIASNGTAGYHVSMDMDWVDPEEAPGVGTPVPGGATYREAHLAMEILADHGGMLGLDIVEVNPILDEHNRTAELAVQLICSAFGKKIL
ncbi:MAG: arginase [Terracidiphilus sp.]|nr:arginase [Terracidiphilus sp.]MDR3796996.1 arginase [Terracidiphilus sp.]